MLVLIFSPVARRTSAIAAWPCDRVLVVFHRQASRSPCRSGSPSRSSSGRWDRSAAGRRGRARSAIAVEAVALDLGGEHAALELEDAKAPAVAEPRGHRGHRLGRADLAPGVERMVAAAARVDQMRIARITG